MTCNEFKNVVFQYSGKLLDKEKHLEAEKHASGCENCKLLAVNISNTLMLINEQKQLQPKPFVYTRVMAKINQREKHTITLYRRVLQPVIIGIIVLVALFGGYEAGETYNTLQNQIEFVSGRSTWDDLSNEPLERVLLADEQLTDF